MEYTALLQVAGIGGNVKYYNPVFEYRHFNGMHGIKPSKEGRNVLAFRFQAQYIQGIGGKVAPPYQRFYQGGEQELRGFDIRSGTPYAFIPQRTQFILTNPDGTPVPRDPTNPTLGNITVPIPTYGIVSVGGDTQFTSNIEYRIPLGGPVTFKLFDDFGMSVATLRQSQLRRKRSRHRSVERAAVRLSRIRQRIVPGWTASIHFDDTIRPARGYKRSAAHVC